MTHELQVGQEYLSYIGTFARPPFRLWGQGGAILEGLYDALAPFGVRFHDFRLEANSQLPTDIGVTATFANRGTHAFRFDRIESKFFNFDAQFYAAIPRILEATQAWLRKTVPSFQFASHQFLYSCHASIKGGSTALYLADIVKTRVIAAGKERGKGLIFHWELPQKKWETHLILDRSTSISDGLYLVFTLNAFIDDVEYAAMAEEGRIYLVDVLKELGLSFPSDWS
jgi:hypothetical protein